MTSDARLIGIRIMQKRKEKGFTQEKLSEKIGISKNHLSNIETGRYIPTIKCIISMCEVLGETPDYYLIGRIAKENDELTELIQRLPPDKQQLLKAILRTYFAETAESLNRSVHQ